MTPSLSPTPSFLSEVSVSMGELICVSSQQHRLHSGQVEFLNQQIVPSFESPERAGLVSRALRQRGFLAVETSHTAAPDLTLAHTLRYLAALEDICRHLDGATPALLPTLWPGFTDFVRRDHPSGIRLGALSRDLYTSVGPGTFAAAVASAGCVTVALERLLNRGRGVAFALGRPPHPHAGPDHMAGYCYLNGTAVAALSARQLGLRVAVIDVDYHHGNGTQDILYGTDVLFCSIHGDPAATFPYLHGFRDETGCGQGEGFNLNVPLAHGAGWAEYAAALSHVVNRVQKHGPDILIVSLGVDTYRGDPIGRFQLDGGDFHRIGDLVSSVPAPTLFVMEGGYAVAEIGDNVANVLSAALG